MGPDESRAVVDAQVSIARIDATLLAIKQQQDHSARTVEQLVRLVEERLSAKLDAVGARFDSIDRQLAEMEAKRLASTLEQAAALEKLEVRLTTVDDKVHLRLTEVERWIDRVSNRAWGFAIGMTFAGGGVGAALVTLVTRLTS